MFCEVATQEGYHVFDHTPYHIIAHNAEEMEKWKLINEKNWINKINGKFGHKYSSVKLIPKTEHGLGCFLKFQAGDVLSMFLKFGNFWTPI